MRLEISKEELGFLLDLVESRVSELHPEIRHSMAHEYKDKLRHELECMQGLLKRLKVADAEQE